MGLGILFVWLVTLTANVNSGGAASQIILKAPSWSTSPWSTTFIKLWTAQLFEVEGNNPSQLDLMFFNEPQNVKSCSVLSPLSDHCPTIAQLEFSPQRANPTTTYSWDYNRADWPSLRNALAKLDWSPVLSTSNVDVALNSWLSMFSAIVQDYVPRKRIRHTGGKPWYSPFLHRLARCRDRLFRRSRDLDSYHPFTRAF